MRARLTPRTKVVFLANPDNPTGTWFLEEELLALPRRGVPATRWWCSTRPTSSSSTAAGFQDALALRKRFPNLVVLRTFSKIYGLAGLRLGYAFARPELVGLPRPRARPLQREPGRAGGRRRRARGRGARPAEPRSWSASERPFLEAGLARAGRHGGPVAGQLRPGRLPGPAGHGALRGAAPRGGGGAAGGGLRLPHRAAHHRRAPAPRT